MSTLLTYTLPTLPAKLTTHILTLPTYLASHEYLLADAALQDAKCAARFSQRLRCISRPSQRAIGRGSSAAAPARAASHLAPTCLLSKVLPYLPTGCLRTLLYYSCTLLPTIGTSSKRTSRFQHMDVMGLQSPPPAPEDKIGPLKVSSSPAQPSARHLPVLRACPMDTAVPYSQSAQGGAPKTRVPVAGHSAAWAFYLLRLFVACRRRRVHCTCRIPHSTPSPECRGHLGRASR